ncbi:MAG: CehA/McbA family metallohydrolase [Candidatus Hydrogenedentes bacterium]|nr:CehA/McbA family metallohydrolase [Candidatus Hydrogenedentota bacterium]
MPVHISHPYMTGPFSWLKGNLHTHTTNSDGDLSPQESVATYAALGYDFLMVSDHDCFTKTKGLDPHGMVLIPGNEITAYGPHLLHVNAHRYIDPDEDRQAMIDAINVDGGFCVVCHPNWLENYNHCDHSLLTEWRDYLGIEIYNGVCRRAEGSPIATDRWDRLLSTGRRVWGFANDDSHKPVERGVAWNVAQVESRIPAAIVRALRDGRFYASTGVAITAIRVENATITVETANAQRCRVFADLSRLQATQEGPAISYTVPDDFPHTYVRVECYGVGDDTAWTQPFFVEKTA